MTAPAVYNRTNADAPPDAVYIGRPSPWGSPFTHKPTAVPGVTVVGDRLEAMDRYEAWLMAQPALVARARRELRGKSLECWCAPLPCHGDILLRVANTDCDNAETEMSDYDGMDPDDAEYTVTPTSETTRPNLVVLDFETTGFPSNKQFCPVRPVQIGAVALDSTALTVLGTFSLDLKPDVWAPSYEHAERVHGLSRAYLESCGTPLFEAWKQFVDWHLPFGHVQFLSWNAVFDHKILQRWQQAIGAAPDPKWPDWFVPGRSDTLHAPNGCLMRLWGRAKGKDVRAGDGLDEAAGVYGLGRKRTVHDALYDAALAATVLEKIVRYG